MRLKSPSNICLTRELLRVEFKQLLGTVCLFFKIKIFRFLYAVFASCKSTFLYEPKVLILLCAIIPCTLAAFIRIARMKPREIKIRALTNFSSTAIIPNFHINLPFDVGKTCFTARIDLTSFIQFRITSQLFPSTTAQVLTG